MSWDKVYDVDEMAKRLTRRARLHGPLMRCLIATPRIMNAKAIVEKMRKNGWRFDSIRLEAIHSFGARLRMTALEERKHANRLASQEFTDTWLHIDVPDELAQIAIARTRSTQLDVEFHWFRVGRTCCSVMNAITGCACFLNSHTL